MPDPEQRVAVAAEWIGKAEEDLRVAVYLLKLGRDCPTASAGFHAQQCVEKYLKAALVVRGVEFPKTHDIEKLVSLLPIDIPLRLPVAQQRTLTIYGTTTRYPGDYEPISLAEVRSAVSIARKVRRELRGVSRLDRRE